MEEERCKVCDSIICEVTLFNGETKHFCSIDCVNTYELISLFRDFVQKEIDKYQYIHKKDIIDFIYDNNISKKTINQLIKEMIIRGYFVTDKYGFIYSKEKIIGLPRAIN